MIWVPERIMYLLIGAITTLTQEDKNTLAKFERIIWGIAVMLLALISLCK